MPDKTWKRLEREVAKILGGVRIPCSGNAGLEGDVLHPTHHIEAKHRQKMILHTWFQKAKKDAQKMKVVKPVILAVRMKNTQTIYAIMEIEELAKLMEAKTDGRTTVQT